MRGQDISRWVPEWQKLYMIFARRGIEIDSYPVLKEYLSAFRERLEPKPEDWEGRTWPGRKTGSYKWYEIQDPVAYWQEFTRPKLCIQRIAFHPRIALDNSGLFLNDAALIFPSTDPWILCCLNSAAMWYHSFRFFPHKKDEALAMDIPYVEQMPIPQPTDPQRGQVEIWVEQLLEIMQVQQATRRDLLDWLRVEHEIDKPTKKLQAPSGLASDAFVAEVKKLRGKKNPLSVAALRSLRDEHTRTIEPARIQAAEALNLERQISDLVNEAYGLTPDEVALMWKTAPPRMPIPKPE